MAIEHIIIPQMGESINEVTLVKLYKKEGDMVKKGDVVADVATDKVDTELTSALEGRLERIVFKNEKDVIPVGAIFASVETGKETAVPASNPSPIIPADQPIVNAEPQRPTVQSAPVSVSSVTTKAPANPKPVSTKRITPSAQPAELITESTLIINTPENPPQSAPVVIKKVNPYLSPVVHQLIIEHRIDNDELALMTATGLNDRITKKDVLYYIDKVRPFRQLQQNHTPEPPPPIRTPPPAVPIVNTPQQAVVHKTEVKEVVYKPQEGERVVPIERMRLAIAKNLLQSKNENVQVTSFSEIDVSNMVQWRDKIKVKFEKNTGQKITYTPLIVEAIVQTLKQFPLLNAVIKGNQIVYREHINIGIATALPDGNLIVPIIKKAENMDLIALTQHINDRVKKAKNNELVFEDIDGGTYTLTNIGTFNSIMGTPIIPPHQSGILATGAIQKKLVVSTNKDGRDILSVRHMMFLSMSYDHRIIDGIVGGNFLNTLGNLLQTFDPERALLF